jgi:hypothetical protein
MKIDKNNTASQTAINGRKYTYEERNGLLKAAMGEGGYERAMKDLAPFGGGIAEYYEIYKIPTHSTELTDLSE